MSQTSSGPAILVEGLARSFGDVHVMRGIDLPVPHGTVLGLLGPNGAGKTTAVRRSIGLAGQSAAIQEELTGRENLGLILIIVAVGCAVGFRFSSGAGPAVAMVALAAVSGLAICCIAAFTAFTGLAIGEESVQAFGLIWMFPLIFVSSAFVPIGSMPGWLQTFANNQPVTYVIKTMRALALGGPPTADLWKSLPASQLSRPGRTTWTRDQTRALVEE